MTSQFMREALDLARRGRSLASPNPLVGAVVVHEGEVVGRGFHTYAGLHHAELIALALAGARAHVQELRHDHDAILTGIGTVLADDCLLNDRSGHARCRPLLRIVMDSQLRLPLDSKMVRSAAGDVVVVTTSAANVERRKALEARGIQVLSFNGPGGRADLLSVVEWLGRERYLSLMIEAGSKLNWTALENGLVDRIFF